METLQENKFRYNVLKLDNKQKFDSNHRKENLPMTKYSVIDFDSKNEIIDCRVYFGKNKTYCCLWVSTENKFISGFISGSGVAGGCGYDRESASIEEACINAGFCFDKFFGGTGLQVEALEAIARFLGFSNFKLFKHYN